MTLYVRGVRRQSFFAYKPGELQNRDIQFNNIYTCAIFCTASLVAC